MNNDAPQLRQRSLVQRLGAETSAHPVLGVRRRSSNFSDYSLNEARRSFQSSTDDLLLPKPPRDARALPAEQSSSAWHSAPLAFALLPAVGGMLFKNGSSVITDIMLLGLAAIFLNWSVRLPWDWYQSAQAIRTEEEGNGDELMDGDSEDESALSMSQATLDELSRPSEGLVSNYNLTIFLLASELRPMAHLVKLVQARTLHLQRIVNSNPYATTDASSLEPKALLHRLEELEARSRAESPGNATADTNLSSKLTADVRRAIQPDLDALTRAVRRYEKRATLQAFQTETKLLDLEARLSDAVSLAAAAASKSENAGFSGWVTTAVTVPLQILGVIVGTPFKILTALVGLVRVGGKSVGAQRPSAGRQASRSANGAKGISWVGGKR
ncbi:hypothetical protein OIDMADRAFT_154543 [Oidiodendron maius Zn]|uniref:Uncharacterized protein n=1 Tax=Oidiodendron maius (strain Zn) TaxID=913774 RepID=A0A0C3HSD0_OIDMZ|nr:hypothetical protein OIDMADRAFT_154543 [Oidiodendron maius Zn]